MTRVETIHNIIIEAAGFCRLKTCVLLPFLVKSSWLHSHWIERERGHEAYLRRALRFLVVVRGR
jgi:hypothetical protein